MKIRVFALILLAAVTAAAQIERSVTITPAEAGQNPYVYVPFDVPRGTRSISVAIEYDKSFDKLDFGLFDQRFSGADNDRRGFRGWSGSVRDNFFIALREATNGYQPGPIRAGRWHLIVGRSRVKAAGVELKVKINFNAIDEAAQKRLEFERNKSFRPVLSATEFPLFRNAGLTWFRGDLHAHTFHGDGSWTVKGALESARANGLDFVALTEHNTFSHHAEIDSLRKSFPGMLIIRGEEVTTYGGHINVWGLPSGGWVDFRLIPGMTASALSIIDQTRAFGGAASINHPTMGCGGCSWTYDKTWETLDSVEIWNATWDADDENALKIWDSFLQQGKRITAIGSSDSHQPPYEPSQYPTNLNLGDPSVFIGAKKLTEPELFDAIRLGRVFVAENPRHSLSFSAGTKSIGDTAAVAPIDLRVTFDGFPADARGILISDGKVVRNEILGDKKEFSFGFKPEKPTYVRLEIRSTDGRMLAMTNPIYFR